MNIVHLLVLILVTSVVFSNTLDNDYHLDSIPRVKENTEIETIRPISRFFTDVNTGSTVKTIAEYRPLMPLSNAINIKIARATGVKRLTGLHLGNIAIHIGTVVLVYFLFCLLLGNWGRSPAVGVKPVHYSHQAFAAALIFAIHPIAGSAVNYIAARDLLLMVFFFVASLLVYFSMRKTGDSMSAWVSSLLLLSLGILSKPIAILGFGIVFLFEWIIIEAKLRDWKLWARVALFSIPTLIYFSPRLQWTVSKVPVEGLNLRREIVVTQDFNYPFTMLDVHLFYYLRNFFWPFEMRTLPGIVKLKSILEPGALLGLLFILCSLLIAWYFRKRNPLIAFSILAYWLLFSITSSIFPFKEVVMDYRQYLPSIFLCLIVVIACFHLKPPVVPLVILTSLTMYFSLSSYHINEHWKTEESFWYQSVKYGSVATAHNNYGLAIVEKNPQLAEWHYLRALELNPTHFFAINLGMLYIDQKKTDKGLAVLRKLVDQKPNQPVVHYWLSRGLHDAGQKEESLAELKFAADLDPRILQYQYEAAEALQAAGYHEVSIDYLQRLLKYNSDYVLARFRLGYAYQKGGQYQLAMNEYKEFLLKNPENARARFNLAYTYLLVDDCKMAIRHGRTVLELAPGHNSVHLLLSRCYRKLGEQTMALKHEKLYKRGG